MTVLWGDTGKVSTGTLKTFTINTPSARETYLSSSPVTLSTSEPATAQVSFTVGNNDLPTLTPSPVFMGNAPIIHVAGKAVTACTLTYKTFINGTQMATGTNAVTAGNNWTYSFVNTQSVNAQVGDIIEVKLWSTQTNTQLDYYAFTMYPTKVALSKPNTILKDLTFTTDTVITHALTQGRQPTPNANATQQCAVYGTTGIGLSIASGGTITIPAVMQMATSVVAQGVIGGQFNVYYGDSGLRTSVGFRQSSSSHPYYERNSMPSTISFREISL
jgi:hypothetical protein